MSTVVLSAFNVAGTPGLGGHFWVYLQYALGLRSLGCEVYWLEQLPMTSDPRIQNQAVNDFLDRMEVFGLADKVLLYRVLDGEEGVGPKTYDFLRPSAGEARRIREHADLLLNFHYSIDPAVLGWFSRTSFVDIDPGLLQFWVSHGQLSIAPHDVSFTTGETVGTPGARFPDCGMDWIRIRPIVSLDHWPYASEEDTGRFTTVSSWWGADGKGEFITDGNGLLYENNKRYSFLEFVDLPRHTSQPLELALCLGNGPPASAEAAMRGRRIGEPRNENDGLDMFQYVSDAEDRRVLESKGWHVRRSSQVAGTPRAYASYLRTSRGEFSCAKPSCMRFQNAWISDRSLCYLASGRPVVVQDTGPSAFLPSGEGMFRFSTLSEAVQAVDAINADYGRHRRAAREIAEAYFDARHVLGELLDAAFSNATYASNGSAAGFSSPEPSPWQGATHDD